MKFLWEKNSTGSFGRCNEPGGEGGGERKISRLVSVSIPV